MGSVWVARTVRTQRLCSTQVGAAGGSSSPVNVVLVAYIPEKPNLVFGHKHGNAQSMNGSIPEPFIVKSASSIQPIEVFFIGFATEVVEAANFKIGEELAIIVVPVIVRVKKPIEIGIGMDKFRMGIDECTSA